MICARGRTVVDRVARARSTRCSKNMAATSVHAALLAVALVVTGCNRTEVWPVLTGEPSRTEAAVDTAPLTPPSPPRAGAKQSGSVTTAPLPSTGGGYAGTGPSSGTFVGQ